MHLLVLSAFRRFKDAVVGAWNTIWSQCTFWCSVLSDDRRPARRRRRLIVSMHLLVLSAFRREWITSGGVEATSLNAPFGAQCFPTDEAASVARDRYVSMHLLVLSAFRL